MTRILLISDTHGHLDPRLDKYIQEADEVWHAGDIGPVDIVDSVSAHKPFRAVFGNIDGTDVRSIYPEDLVFNCEQVKVYMTHIGGYPGKYPARIKSAFELHQPKLFICGHSHILKVMHDPKYNLLHMNPGACGVQGFHTVKTALRFEIDKSEIKNLSVIELGKRTSVTS